MTHGMIIHRERYRGTLINLSIYNEYNTQLTIYSNKEEIRLHSVTLREDLLPHRGSYFFLTVSSIIQRLQPYFKDSSDYKLRRLLCLICHARAGKIVGNKVERRFNEE